MKAGNLPEQGNKKQQDERKEKNERHQALRLMPGAGIHHFTVVKRHPRESKLKPGQYHAENQCRDFEKSLFLNNALLF